MKDCIICNEEFEPNIHNQIYCNSECRKKEQRKRYLANRKKRIEYAKKYAKMYVIKLKKKRPYRLKALGAYHQLLKKGKGINIETKVTVDEIEELFSKYFNCCYCKRSFENRIYGLDHIISLSNGGKNILLNLIVCCNQCNSCKKGMSLEVWKHNKGINPEYSNWILKRYESLVNGI